MSDRLAKQTFFCFVLSWGRGGGWMDVRGVERNLNLLFTCRSMYCRSKLILRWEKRFQFCEIYHLDLFFLIYSKLKNSLVPLVFVVVLFFAPLLVFFYYFFIFNFISFRLFVD